ncbi:hypothetical protein [Aliivibrio fischeri]|uniref:Uncharacterized protein n=1 Tax=Aliivibrio fischeri SR5 TaxID=1088719 RepID=A0AAV3EN41_ALIFS|nr:hypothetical protein [Aliivibrio fischeri]EHN67949.1 hypothetical protein VFSR5_2766 [Aliivibrio fischeri SR5]
MKIIFMILLSCVYIISLFCLLHFVYYLVKAPQSLFERLISSQNTFTSVWEKRIKKYYIVLTMMSVCVITFLGVKGFLFFIPDSFGLFYDGSFHLIKDTVAGIAAFGSIALIDVIRNYLIMYNELNTRN